MERKISPEAKALAEKLLSYFEGHSLLFADCVISELRQKLYKLSYEAPIVLNQESLSGSDKI